MLSSLKNIVRVADLRNKVLFTLLVIAIYQLGANIPVPGVSFKAIQSISNAAKGSGILGFLNLFSGGALARAAVLGLGIMPYITSSIIIQLLTTVIPKFSEWRDQGAVGQRKLTQATRYLTISLALMQSSGLVFLLHSGELLGGERRPHPGLHRDAGAVHHPHVHRRHGVRHVARRAHHPARHRPGDVDHHLRQRRRDHPPRRRPHQGGQVLVGAGDHRHRLRGAARRDRLRRARPAPDPRDLRPPGPGSPHVRRPEHLHPAQGEPGRRDPDHLRELAPLHPGAHLDGAAVARRADLDHRRTS